MYFFFNRLLCHTLSHTFLLFVLWIMSSSIETRPLLQPLHSLYLLR